MSRSVSLAIWGRGCPLWRGERGTEPSRGAGLSAVRAESLQVLWAAKGVRAKGGHQESTCAPTSWREGLAVQMGSGCPHPALGFVLTPTSC